MLVAVTCPGAQDHLPALLPLARERADRGQSTTADGSTRCPTPIVTTGVRLPVPGRRACEADEPTVERTAWGSARSWVRGCVPRDASRRGRRLGHECVDDGGASGDLLRHGPSP